MSYITKKAKEINPNDIIVNIGIVKKVQPFTNHIIITYNDNYIKGYKPTEELLLEKPSKLNGLFKPKNSY